MQTCVSRVSWMDCVSTQTSKAYLALMLSVIESSLKRVESSTATCYGSTAPTPNLSAAVQNGDWRMTDRTPRQETRGRTAHGFVRNTIESYKECYKRTHIPRGSREGSPIETSSWSPGLKSSLRVADTPLCTARSNSRRNPTEERTTRCTSNDQKAGWHSGGSGMHEHF